MRRTARDFVEDNLIPIIEECFRTERFPRELVPVMGELGFFGANLEGYGCAGMSNVEYGLVMQELERGDSGFRSFVSVQSALVMYPIYTFGSDEQKNTWLPALASGKKLGCFGLTEPGFGSNPGGMTTTARKVGDEYILNGEKMWITSGNIADVAVIWAKVEDEDGLGPRLPGRNRSPRLYRLRGPRQVEPSRLHNQRPLPAGCPHPRLQSVARLRRPQEPAHVPQPGALRHQLGRDRRRNGLLRHRATYSKTRKQFNNQPIASHQLIQEKLVWMLSEISKAQLLSLHVGRLKDAGTVGHQHISMAKRNNVWMALETARMARDILGANGITEDYPIMRHMMNLESVKTYEGTHDIHALILGQHITGIAAY